jgi:hypothetical protein
LDQKISELSVNFTARRQISWTGLLIFGGKIGGTENFVLNAKNAKYTKFKKRAKF